MKLTIDMDIDTAAYDEQVGGWFRYVYDPAIAEGINATAFLARDALTPATRQQFDRPTSFTQLGFGV